MRKLESLSADKILDIQTPEALFSRFPQEAKKEYRILAMQWHPDTHSSNQATEVFTHIAALYRESKRKQETGTWNEPLEKAEEEESGIKKFRCLGSGAIKSINFLSARPFELGTMYIADQCVSFEVQNEFTDLFHNARKIIRNLGFTNQEMAIEMSKCLPYIDEIIQTDHSNILCIRKTPDQLLLADVIKHMGNKLEPIDHIGWILNVLFNISCYLKWSGLTHNDISPETFFISPLRHSGMLLGGWWYATAEGKAFHALPDRSMKFLPDSLISKQIAGEHGDIELIKAVGREILGDKTGASSTLDKAIPPELAKWLNSPSTQGSIRTYKTWKYKVLKESFGEAKFVEMRLDSSNLYKEK